MRWGDPARRQASQLAKSVEKSVAVGFYPLSFHGTSLTLYAIQRICEVMDLGDELLVRLDEEKVGLVFTFSFAPG